MQWAIYPLFHFIVCASDHVCSRRPEAVRLRLRAKASRHVAITRTYAFSRVPILLASYLLFTYPNLLFVVVITRPSIVLLA